MTLFFNQYEAFEIGELVILFILLSASALYFAVGRTKESFKLTGELELVTSNDALTNLYNRHYILQQLSTEIYRSIQNSSTFSVILIELDNFKDINTAHGAEFCDRVLVRVSESLTRNIRTMDYVARWGNSEFLIVCPETETQSAIGITSKLLHSTRQIKINGVDGLTASFGVTSFQIEDTIESLLKRVNSGLHEAKEEGQNRFITVV
ncbi:GGDEF domain-containing protein [Aliikangiella sp. IMCC44359]|uniref:GGDEF domain-containing protein n=1 Tax=Aliikangiella sp. IMCC44359 TaxID=3459125 RepID=UPI00403B02A1